MKVFDLNGKEFHWPPPGYRPKTYKKSKLHLQARALLKEVYPNIIILEEVPIRIYASRILHLDFYLPLYKKAIEVHGSQHYEFNTQFHTTAFDFKRQQLNDTLKDEWCVKNNINLVVLPHFRTEAWKQIVKS
jgi:hypothetical protein